jgi:hypothetical protein
MVNQYGEAGDVYISATGQIYSDEDMTPERIEKIRLNVYGKGISTKVQALIFADEPTITVEDPEGNVDEELSQVLQNMYKKARVWSAKQIAYDDILWHGISIFNPVWIKDETSGYIVLDKMRHLPADSFTTAPSTITEIFARRLVGIVLNSKGEVEYWQTNNKGNVVHIKNAASIIDPTSRFIDGDPVMLPLIPIIEMLKYTWNSQMQQVNRVGAKILFIKITNPRPASANNGNVSDVDYATDILRNWGKDTSFLLRDNMEIIDLGIKDDSNNLEVIDKLYDVALDYISPSGLIARRGDSGLAGGEKEREKLLSQKVAAIHSWLEEQFEQILQKFFEYNQFPPGWNVFINIPSPRVDQTATNIQKVDMCMKWKILPPSRALEILELEPLTEEEKAELDSYIEASKGTMDGGLNEAGFIESKNRTEDIVSRKLEARLHKLLDTLEEDVMAELDRIDMNVT